MERWDQSLGPNGLKKGGGAWMELWKASGASGARRKGAGWHGSGYHLGWRNKHLSDDTNTHTPTHNTHNTHNTTQHTRDMHANSKFGISALHFTSLLPSSFLFFPLSVLGSGFWNSLAPKKKGGGGDRWHCMVICTALSLHFTA